MTYEFNSIITNVFPASIRENNWVRWEREHLEHRSGCARRCGHSHCLASSASLRLPLRRPRGSPASFGGSHRRHGEPVIQPAVGAMPLFGSTNPTGLSPSQIQSAYGLNQINFGNVTGNGAGQTIAIIDAYYDPNIASDLQKFDAQYGLQAPPSFTQYVQNGLVDTTRAGRLNSARRGMGARDGSGGQYRAGRSAADVERSFQRRQLCQQSAGCLGRLDELGSAGIRRRIGLRQRFHDAGRPQRRDVRGIFGRLGNDRISLGLAECLSVGGTTLNVTSQGNFISETPWSQSGTGTSPFESQPAWQAGRRAQPGFASPAGPRPTSRSTPTRRPASRSTIRSRTRAVGLVYRRRHQRRAPSWAGLIAIADQGLALNGVGSLSNAQASLYQISSSSFNHPTTGTGSASTTFAPATGLGSPKASQVVSALVQITRPLPPRRRLSRRQERRQLRSTTGTWWSSPRRATRRRHRAEAARAHLQLARESRSRRLNPTTIATSTTPTLAPVIIVPAPLPPIVFHLGSSSSPVIAQIVNSALAASEEQPPSTTQFGQALETELQKPFEARLDVDHNARG